jgi:hypothetical protein
MDPTGYTSLNEIEQVSILTNYSEELNIGSQAHAVVDAAFRSGKTRPIAYRKRQLARLAYMIKVSIVCHLHLVYI